MTRRDPARSASTGLDPAIVSWGRTASWRAWSRTSPTGACSWWAGMDAEALAATLGTGEVHFHSRSRGRLWRKGETSGNILRLRSLAARLRR